MIQVSPQKSRYQKIADAILEIVKELHAWEKAEDVKFYQIWKTDNGKYYCTFKKQSDKQEQLRSSASEHAPLIHFCEAFCEIAGQNDFIIHHIYRPGNIPGHISFRLECYKTLHHYMIQE